MKKYTFLVYHRDYEKFLETLQEQGVIHIVEKAAGDWENEHLAELHKTITELKKSIRQLKRISNTDIQPVKGDGIEILDKIKQLQKQIEHNNHHIAAIQKEIDTVTPWGEYDPANFKKVADAGYQMRFFISPLSKIDEQWFRDYNIEIIRQTDSLSYFVVISEMNAPINIDAEEIKLPGKSLSMLKQEKEQLEQENREARQTLDQIARESTGILMYTQQKLEEELDFKRATLHTTDAAEEKLKILEGWIPRKNEEEFNTFLKDQPVLFEEEQTSPEDKAPVLLKNKEFPRLFEPIGELYTLPSYRELDLTPFFAPFFMLFFGFCLGDAGYGLLIMAAVLVARNKVKPAFKPFLKLGMFLGIATVIMGVLSGTIFGIMLLEEEFQWLSNLKTMMLDSKQLMFLALALGFVQILLGMFLKASNRIRMYGFKHAISTFGWIFIVLGGATLYFLNDQNMISGQEMRIGIVGVAIIGGIPALFMNSPDKNIFLNFGVGIWDTYNMVSGLLGDLLSYIRLFALGIASAVLGNVFNQLAFELSPDIIILKQLFILVILLFGHSLNFFMAALGAFVHPLRLTFVEFYKNAGFTGGGKKYMPFQKANV